MHVLPKKKNYIGWLINLSCQWEKPTGVKCGRSQNESFFLRLVRDNAVYSNSSWPHFGQYD